MLKRNRTAGLASGHVTCAQKGTALGLNALLSLS